MAYLGSEHVLWGLLYGEIFLNIEHDTTGDDELKTRLFTGYKTMFDNFANGIPDRNNTGTFENAVLRVYSSLTPVISDGITTDNLTMVRARFFMDWFSGYAKKYPYSLFSYQDNLIRSGHFDIYDQWLFGKAEGLPQYEAWNNFHEGDIDRFLKWRSTAKLQPVTADFYNSRDIKGIFNKRKPQH